MSNALNNQVDGNHYTEMGIQPIQLAYMLGASPCFTKVAKYLTRKKDNPAQQVAKAIHCIELEKSLITDNHVYGNLVDKVDVYSISAPQDYKMWITKFSAQFQYARLICETLVDMYEGDYEQALWSARTIKAHMELDNK